MEETKHGEKRCEKVEARRPKGIGPRGQIPWPHGTHQFVPHNKVLDNSQEQGITVAPLNVKVGYRSAGARRKSYLFPTTKVSQVLVDYALDRFKELDG